MELFIAGGVGEHGRNCFYVQTETLCFLVDCGKKVDSPEDPYPRLTQEQIKNLDVLFITHSHNDHAGAIPWLYENGFQGAVIATEETLRQLSFTVQNEYILNKLCPNGRGHFQQLLVQWGRSGHCAGGVWYHFSEKNSSILFSGDYTENTQIYVCDVLRGQQADVAVLDCAYGKNEINYTGACERLVVKTKELLLKHKLVLFTVPKYGRGLEILKIFTKYLNNNFYYADNHFLQSIAELNHGGFWYKQNKISTSIQPYCGQSSGIIFVSDPQLRSSSAQNMAEQVLSMGGIVVMTGTVEKGSYSEALLQDGNMVFLPYPVHLNYAQFRQLESQNNFIKTIPYHSKDFTSVPRICF